MVHGFDNNGKAYDKDGFKLNWWTKEEEKDYANRTKCLVKSFIKIFSQKKQLNTDSEGAVQVLQDNL